MSSRYRWLELKDAPKCNLELGSTRGELRGVGSGRRQLGYGMTATREEDRGAQELHELGFFLPQEDRR